MTVLCNAGIGKTSAARLTQPLRREQQVLPAEMQGAARNRNMGGVKVGESLVPGNPRARQPGRPGWETWLPSSNSWGTPQPVDL